MINNKLLDNAVSMVNILKVGVNDHIPLCLKKILDIHEGKTEKTLKKKRQRDRFCWMNLTIVMRLIVILCFLTVIPLIHLQRGTCIKSYPLMFLCLSIGPFPLKQQILILGTKVNVVYVIVSWPWTMVIWVIGNCKVKVKQHCIFLKKLVGILWKLSLKRE